MSIEAMKQALEALTRIWEDGLENFPESGHDAAITALRTAIEQAEKQEPVAWLYWDSWGTMKLSQIMPPPIGAFPVYTTPPAAQRQPLTEDEVLRLWAGDVSRPVLGKNKVLAFARAIAAAYGITGENT